MRKILRITRLELSILFYSPAAWVVMIIFMVQCGINIMDLLQERESSQQLDSVLKSITADVFSGYKGFFQSVLKYTYLYIPLLTMGIISRELSNGSIKLLQSSPVTNFQIVLGKYLALIGFSVYFILVLLGIAITASLLIDNFDWGIITAGIVGIFLLIGAYAAIGLFMSSLTSYQVVAAISTLAIFAGLNFIGEIGKGNEFVREITYWLSLQGRTDHFVNGMISSQNTFYFLLVVTLFLGLTIMRLNDGRIVRTELQRSLRYIGFITSVLLVGYITSMPTNWYFWDLSRFQANTLTDNSKDVIAHLDQPILVKNYVNILHPHGRLGTPKWRKFDLKQFDQYTRYIPNMQMDYIYYYDYVPRYADSSINLVEKAQKAALAHGVEFSEVRSPEEIKKLVNLAPEQNAYVRYIHHGQDSVALRMFLDATGYPKESEITSALKRLYSTVPLVGFLEGHDERSIFKIGDKDYQKITSDIQSRTALVNNGFDIKVLTPSQIDGLAQNLTVLVIADPYSSYSNREREAILRYIQRGGNLLIASEPGKQALINPLLEDLPVHFDSFQLYQKSKDVEPTVLAARVTPGALSAGFAKNSKSIISMAGTGAIHIDSALKGFHVDPILISDTQHVWKGQVSVDTSGNQSDGIAYVLGAKLTRDVLGRKQKIMLMADADFMSNSELSRYNLRTVNSEFTISLFKWFTGGEFPVDTTRPESIDNRILVESDTLKMIKYTWIGLLPGVITLLGGFLLIRRKRK
ncbi:MAG: Gldg family protein [Sphingobacterium sp.]|nr:Gldg family protein [Sphingobacterium sp.]